MFAIKSNKCKLFARYSWSVNKNRNKSLKDAEPECCFLKQIMLAEQYVDKKTNDCT